MIHEVRLLVKHMVRAATVQEDVVTILSQGYESFADGQVDTILTAYTLQVVLLTCGGNLCFLLLFFLPGIRVQFRMKLIALGFGVPSVGVVLGLFTKSVVGRSTCFVSQFGFDLDIVVVNFRFKLILNCLDC